MKTYKIIFDSGKPKNAGQDRPYNCDCCEKLVHPITDMWLINEPTLNQNWYTCSPECAEMFILQQI